MEQGSCIEMVYAGESTRITCPAGATYEDYIAIAIERFSIPYELKNFIRVFVGDVFIFDKKTFEKYIAVYANPDIVFEIRVNYLAFWVNNPHLNARSLMDSTNKRAKRKSVDDSECDDDQPQGKRLRADYSRGSDSMDF